MAELTYRGAPSRPRHRPGDATATRRSCSSARTSGAAGGVFKLTEGLFAEFGPDRVRDTPISEQAIVGAAMGAAMTGLRPIAELMFSDFFAVTWDMVVNQIAKTRYMTDGQVSLPLVLRTANGAGLRFGAQHSQSIENWAMAIPGLKVVAPSTPADMVGLMAAAIRDPDPVIVCEHKALFADKAEVPDGEHRRHAGHARASSGQGRDATHRRARGHGPEGGRRRRPPGRRARHRRRGHRPALARPARHRGHPRARSPRPAGCSPSRRTRGCAAGARRSPRSSPMRASTASMRRSSGSRPRTSRSPRRPPSRTWPCRRSSGSSRRCGGGWTTPRLMAGADRAAVLGTGRMGSAMAERLAGPGRRRSSSTTGRRTGRRRSPRGSARPWRPPRPRRPRGPTSSSRWSPTTPRSATLFDGRGWHRRRRPRPGSVAVDMSTVLPDTIRAVAPAVRARGAGILDAPVSGSVTSTLARRADDHGRRRPGGPRARPPGPRLPRPARLPPRAPRDRRRHEARGQHGHLRAQRGRSQRRSSSPSATASTARLAYDVLAASAVGAPYVGYKRAAFLEPDATPVAFSLALAAKDLRPHRRPRRGARARRCRRRRSTSTRSMRRSDRWGSTPISRRSRVTCVRRAGDDRSAMRRAQTGRSSSRQPADPTAPHTRERSMTDRLLIKGGYVLTQDPTLGELAGADVLIEDDKIAAVGHDLSADGARTIDADRRHRHPGLHRHPPPHLGDLDPDRARRTSR